MSDDALMELFRILASGDDGAAVEKLDSRPALTRASLHEGASREVSEDFFLDAIRHHVYAGDTALHVASAAHRVPIVTRLLASGADPHAKNRRGAAPLHYATDGGPGLEGWSPSAQAEVIALLLSGGADVNATDRGGATPLHRAVRNRCADAVRALLAGGADQTRKNDGGSTPADLVMKTTGRGGVGSDEAKNQQRVIAALLGVRT